MASQLSAATIANPGFEADTFSTFPGYISGNGPITGWTANADARAGLNPAGGSPFANNGTIPQGSQVAFIQSDATVTGGVTLSNNITGLTLGETYKVRFRMNARTGNTPNLKVEIDGTRIIDTAVTAVGAAAPYQYFAFDFTATATSHGLTLRNDAGGDNTLVVDDFSIETRNSGWSYAAWSDDISSGIDGSKIYTHAYNFGSATPTTINGINFTGVAGGNPAIAGRFSTAGLPNVFANDANNVTGGSRQMANDFIYGGPGQSLTINGLVPGGVYVATVYSVGWENGTRAMTWSVGNDRLTVNQDHFGDNNGIRVSYRYTATANSITLRFDQLQGNSWHAYGFANEQVSVPAAPAFTQQPRSQRVGVGETVTITVAATGDAPLLFHWFKDGQPLDTDNSASLELPGVTEIEAGVYSVIASNAFGIATSSNAVLRVGLPIANRSFEADTFTVFPGYISGNGPITSWTGLGGHGLNPAAGSPFADNGAIPDGQKVAFMQQDGALSQMVSGFTVGDVYYVLYSENARSGGVPAIEVKIGDTTIVPAHNRAPVGGANPYVEMISDAFTATGADMQLSFVKSNPNGGDTTALIDNVAILRIAPGTAPFLAEQPVGVIAQVGESATLSARAAGSLPLTFFWLKNGAVLPNSSNRVYAVTAATKADEGDYQFVASNSSGSITSAVARLTVWEPIASLFNTGLDANHLPLADGLTDPNYALLTNPDLPDSTNAIVEDSTQFPIVSGPWLANSASSKWIGPKLNTSASAVGLYTYRTTFNLTNRDPATVQIIGAWASDNSGRDIRVNGVSTGNPQSPGFGGFTTFTIGTNNATFLPGINTIEFVVENEAAPGYTGLKVEFRRSNARILPNIRPEVTASPGSQTAIEGDSLSLSAMASGSDPLSWQWYRNGVLIGGQTNRTLALSGLAECDSGQYSAIVTNNSGSATTQVATVSVAFRRVPGLYGTGVDDTGALLPAGSVDLHYILGSSADPAFPGPDAFVLTEGPIPPWVANGPRSQWISANTNQNLGNAEGNYTFQTFFDLTGVDISRFRISGQWAVDNTGTDILINGVSTGITSPGFNGMTPFTITSGFVDGANALDFVINNLAPTPNPGGLRVDLQGLIDIRPRISVRPLNATQVQVSWTSTNTCHQLEASASINGPWTNLGPGPNPRTVDTTGFPVRFFRITP